MIRSKPYAGARRIILTSGVGMFVFVSWASFARVDEVTRGQGRVIPSSKAQIVQSSEPASILYIVVRSGQPVRKGQLLVRLDDTESSSQLGQITAENRSLAAQSFPDVAIIASPSKIARPDSLPSRFAYT